MKSLNQYHRQFCQWLSELGISYMEEYEAGPYSLDIYLPEMNLAVEIDGPSHNRVKDWERDMRILSYFGIKTVRVKVGEKKEKALDAILRKSS